MQIHVSDAVNCKQRQVRVMALSLSEQSVRQIEMEREKKPNKMKLYFNPEKGTNNMLLNSNQFLTSF